MKKLSATIITLLVLVFSSVILVSCIERQETIAVAPNSTLSAIGEEDLDSNQLKVLTDIGNNFEAINIGSENGYYQMIGQNIYYTDYDTATRLVLCSSPNCEHNDEGCSSFFYGNGTLFLDYTSENLFFLGRNNPMSEHATEEAALNSDIIGLYRMDLSGAGRELIFEFAKTENLAGTTVISDTESLYLSYFSSEGGHKKYLGRIDLNSSRLSQIKELAHDEHLVSASGNILYTEQDGKIYAHNIETGDTNIRYELNYDKESFALYGDIIYIYTTASGEITSYNLVSGKQTTIAKTPGGATNSFIGIISEKYIQILDYYEDEQRHHIVDVNSNEVYNIELKKSVEWSEHGALPLAIIAATNEYALIVPDSKEIEVISYDPGGVPFTSLIPVDVNALITWDDLLASNPNYIYIEEFANSNG